MSGATTATYISIGLAIAGTAASTVGAYQQSQAQKSQANYQAAVARNNVIISNRQAEDAIKRGEDQEDQHRQKVIALKGRQRASLAASGFQVNEDDALDILADTEEMGELDALTIKNNAEREAYGHRIQGMNSQAQAGLYASKASSINPGMTAGSTLFSGAGSVADKWAHHKNTPTT